MRRASPSLIAYTLLAAVLLLGGCATHRPTTEAQGIGPYTDFSARLIVIDSARRWQVSVQWNGTPEQGEARILHAASNRIVRIAWQGDRIMLLDNLAPDRGWAPISEQQLQAHGIILPPGQIARILSGNMPPELVRKKNGEWEGKLSGTLLHIRWIGQAQRVELTDVTHGRKAILIIES